MGGGEGVGLAVGGGGAGHLLRLAQVGQVEHGEQVGVHAIGNGDGDVCGAGVEAIDKNVIGHQSAGQDLGNPVHDQFRLDLIDDQAGDVLGIDLDAGGLIGQGIKGLRLRLNGSGGLGDGRLGGSGGLGDGRLGGNGGRGGLLRLLGLVHILQHLCIEHDEGAKALALVDLEFGVGAAGRALEADILQVVVAELHVADAIEGQDGHVGIALVQPAVVDGLHDCVADQGGAGGLIGVGAGLGGIHVVQPHTVGGILAGLHAVHQLLELDLHGLQILALHRIHHVNDGGGIPADGAQPIGARVGFGGVGGVVEQLLGAVVHVVADPLQPTDDQIQLCGIADALGVLSPEGQDHIQTVQPQVGRRITGPGVAEVVAGIGQGVLGRRSIQVVVQRLGHGQIAAVAGHLIGIQEQRCGLVAVCAVGVVITGALLLGVIGTLGPGAVGGDQAGHVFHDIVLVLLIAGHFVQVLNTLEDDAIVIAPVEKIAFAVGFSLFVVPGELGLEFLDHSRGIVACIVQGDAVDVLLGLIEGGGQSSIAFSREHAHRQKADDHDRTQQQADNALHSFHSILPP